jgi:uncharacterized repeat protein (TIGR03833 family)
MEQQLKDIKKGMKVEIITKQGKLAKGFVDDVAAKASYYGIIVRLKSGEIGSVKKILLSEEEISKRDSVEINKMIEKGENFYVEFKSSTLWSLNLSENEIRQSKSFDLHCFKQKTSKVIIAKSIAALLNSGGGSLVIGVKEKKEDHGKLEVIGIDDELKKLNDRDNNRDGYKRMIIDDILRSFFPPKIYNHLNDYIWINFVEMDIGETKKTICWIKVKKCDVKVFLKINDKEIFIIRTDTENRALEGERLVDYCMKRFER